MDTVPLLFVNVIEFVNPELDDTESSYPAGTVTTMSAVKLLPATVNVFTSDAEPTHAVNVFKVPVTDTTGGLPLNKAYLFPDTKFGLKEEVVSSTKK